MEKNAFSKDELLNRYSKQNIPQNANIEVLIKNKLFIEESLSPSSLDIPKLHTLDSSNENLLINQSSKTQSISKIPIFSQISSLLKIDIKEKHWYYLIKSSKEPEKIYGPLQSEEMDKFFNENDSSKDSCIYSSQINLSDHDKNAVEILPKYFSSIQIVSKATIFSEISLKIQPSETNIISKIPEEENKDKFLNLSQENKESKSINEIFEKKQFVSEGQDKSKDKKIEDQIKSKELKDHEEKQSTNIKMLFKNNIPVENDNTKKEKKEDMKNKRDDNIQDQEIKKESNNQKNNEGIAKIEEDKILKEVNEEEKVIGKHEIDKSQEKRKKKKSKKQKTEKNDTNEKNVQLNHEVKNERSPDSLKLSSKDVDIPKDAKGILKEKVSESSNEVKKELIIEQTIPEIKENEEKKNSDTDLKIEIEKNIMNNNPLLQKDKAVDIKVKEDIPKKNSDIHEPDEDFNIVHSGQNKKKKKNKNKNKGNADLPIPINKSKNEKPSKVVKESKQEISQEKELVKEKIEVRKSNIVKEIIEDKKLVFVKEEENVEDFKVIPKKNKKAHPSKKEIHPDKVKENEFEILNTYDPSIISANENNELSAKQKSKKVEKHEKFQKNATKEKDGSKSKVVQQNKIQMELIDDKEDKEDNKEKVYFQEQIAKTKINFGKSKNEFEVKEEKKNSQKDEKLLDDVFISNKEEKKGNQKKKQYKKKGVELNPNDLGFYQDKPAPKSISN